MSIKILAIFYDQDLEASKTFKGNFGTFSIGTIKSLHLHRFGKIILRNEHKKFLFTISLWHMVSD